MSEGGAAEQGFFGGIRLGLTVLLAGFLPPFVIVWLLTARSQNQLLTTELGGEEQVRTLAEIVQPIAFAAAVALGWVLLLVILLLILRSFGRVGDLRDLRARRSADKALARDTQLPADAWGEAVVRRRKGASTAPVAPEPTSKEPAQSDAEPGA